MFDRYLNGYSVTTAARRVYAAALSAGACARALRGLPRGTLRAGVAGTGSFFRYAYLPALNHPRCPLDVTALCSRREESLAAARRRLRHSPELFTSYDRFLDSGIGAAILLVPTCLHVEFARKALSRGLDVFCEKPVANTVAEAVELQQLAEAGGRTLMVGFNERYLHRARVLKRLLDEGAVGRVTEVRAFHNQDLVHEGEARGVAALESTGGGVLHNAAVHLLNLMLHFFGQPETVRARLENRALPESYGEDNARCELTFPGGLKATLVASYTGEAASTYEHIRIVGEQGELWSDMRRGDITRVARDGTKQRIACRRETMADSVLNELRHFRSVVQTRSVPETDINDAVRTLRTVKALYTSASLGHEVKTDANG